MKLRNNISFSFFIFWVYFIPTSIFAVEDRDSIRLKMQDADVCVRLEAITHFAWIIRDENLDSSLVLAHQAQELNTKTCPELKIGYNAHILGSLYSLKGNYEKSEKWLMIAYEIRKKYPDEKKDLIITLNNLFYTYQGLGQPKKMYKYISEAEKLILEVYKEISGTNIITQLQMAEMFLLMKRPEKAIEKYLYGIELAKKVKKGHDYYMDMAYTNYGTYLSGNGEFDKAIECFEIAEKHYFKISKPEDRKPNINMAIAYAETGQTDKALDIFEKAYERDKNSGNEYNLSTSSNNLAYFHFMNGNINKALPLFLESIEHAKKAGATKLESDRYEMVSECYEQKGDFRMALKYRKMHHSLKDSILDAETLKQINETTEKYESEKKEKKILEYEKVVAENLLKEKEQNEIIQNEKSRSRRNRIIFSSVIVVVLIIGGFVFYSYRQKQKANLELEAKNNEIKSQHMLLEEKHKEITDSINYAQRIQTALLTNDEYWKQISKDSFVYFRPKDVVSGDFFWAYQVTTNAGDLAIWCAADCTGHGVPGAFMSMLGITFLNEIVVEQGEIEPNIILNKLRIKIIKALEQKSVDVKQQDGMDMALCVWKKWDNTIQFSGANNPLWIFRLDNPMDESWINENNLWFKEFKPDKMPVGSYNENLQPFQSQTIQLQKGDMLYTFSDGYSDQFGGDPSRASGGKKFKEANFKKLLFSISNQDSNHQKEKIHQTFENWKGELEQIDDVCIIGVRI